MRRLVAGAEAGEKGADGAGEVPRDAASVPLGVGAAGGDGAGVLRRAAAGRHVPGAQAADGETQVRALVHANAGRPRGADQHGGAAPAPVQLLLLNHLE